MLKFSEEKQLELDEDFLNPGPIRALSRVPSRVQQSDFRQWSQEREVAQDGDLDGEAAQAMRATQDHHLDELDLEEDLDFFMSDEPRQAPGEVRSEIGLPDRNSLLRSLASQKVPSAGLTESTEQADVDDLADEGPSNAKKQKLASADDEGLELEIEDDFDFLENEPQADVNPTASTEKTHNGTAIGHHAPRSLQTSVDELEMDDAFEEMLRSDPSPPEQTVLPSKSPPQLPRSLPDHMNVVSGSHLDLTTTLSTQNTTLLSRATDLDNSSPSGVTSSSIVGLPGSSQWKSLSPIAAMTFDGRKIWLPRRKRLVRVFPNLFVIS